MIETCLKTPKPTVKNPWPMPELCVLGKNEAVRLILTKGMDVVGTPHRGNLIDSLVEAVDRTLAR